REVEPRITGYASRALHTASDAQIDNRKLCKALRERCEMRGVVVREQSPVEEILVEESSVRGVRSPEGRVGADRVILCAGAYTPQIDGLPEPDRVPVRPVKGQALSVGLSSPPEINHVIRGTSTYCVPKGDGRMVIGSTMEEEGFDTRVTAGGVLDLLHKAYEILPFVYENELLETWAGLRPASRDSLPILGPSSHTDGLAFATGHYRNGILLTPITVQLVSEWFRSGSIPELMETFLPARFQG
ncbi:MAG: FAD-dependent oxidoreductase, partial [bacterium]